MIGGGLDVKPGEVIGYVAQPVDACSSTTDHPRDELAMRALDPRKLVEVNRAGGGLPPDSSRRVVLEQQLAADRDLAGKLQRRRMVEDEQVGVGGSVGAVADRRNVHVHLDNLPSSCLSKQKRESGDQRGHSQ